MAAPLRRLVGLGSMVDVVVVGAGPNGLAAAITCARGRSIGARAGGHRRASAAARGRWSSRCPGFRHDVCSAIHPLAVGVAVLRGRRARAPRARAGPPRGRRWPTRSTAGGPACCTGRSRTPSPAWASTAGRGTATSGGRPGTGTTLAPDVLGPLRPRPAPPPHDGARSGCGRCCRPPWLAARAFETDEAQGPVRGQRGARVPPAVTGRSPPRPASCSPRRRTWPAGRWPRAGRRRSPTRWRRGSPSSAARSRSDRPVRSLADLPDSRAVLFDLTPAPARSRSVGDAAAAALPHAAGALPVRPGGVQGRLRAVRAGAVDERGLPPRGLGAPRRHASRRSRAAEAEVGAGQAPDRPVRAGRPSRAASTPPGRPDGQHTLWTYCHVPHGSDVDMTDAIEAQLERFAPGFRDVVLARHVAGADLVRGAQRRTSSAATSPAGPTTASSSRCAPARASTPTAPRTVGSSCARPPRRPAAGSTACAATTPPKLALRTTLR